jgi:hypothetical protein
MGAPDEWRLAEPFRARHAELLYWGVKDENHAQALVNGSAECTWAVCEDRVPGAPAHWFACDAPLVGGRRPRRRNVDCFFWCSGRGAPGQAAFGAGFALRA